MATLAICNICDKTQKQVSSPTVLQYETWRLEKHEIQVKDSKDLAFNTRVKHHYSNQEDESTSEEDDDLIKKFENFLRKEIKKEIIKREEPIRC